MKGGYVTIVVFAAMVVMVFGGEVTIRPIPDKCPLEDNLDYTVHIKHESDCTKFYKCFRGEPIEMSCPKMNKRGDKLHFNALLQVCDYPNKAGCIDPPSTVYPTSTPSHNGTWNCKSAEDGFLIPHETRCYLYYKCIKHVPQLNYCNEGYYFDPYDQVCKSSDNGCPLKDACRNYRGREGKYFPDPYSCKHVYYCKDTTTTRYVCDEDAEWSADVEKCLSKEMAHCGMIFNQ